MREPEIRALGAPEAYPRDPSAARGVERVQTHISEVFLTGDRVYKFRKAVDLGFVRFADRDSRNEDCLREVALNRRLAPDVYLGVAPLEGKGAVARVGPVGEALAGRPGHRPEHCVVMRRLPAGRDALSLLAAGRLSHEMLERLARRIAGFHGDVGLGSPAPFTREAWFECCTRPMRDCLEVLGRTLRGEDAERLSEVSRRALRVIEQQAPRFESRRLAGRAVDGHGDLHLQHAWYEDDAAAPLVVDCLEFDSGLRRIDVAADVAFTAMDLAYRGRRDLAEHFLAVYAGERDDHDLYAVVDGFAAYRALVRAKVAGLAAHDVGLPASQREAATASARRHLDLAGELLVAPDPGRLLLVAGSVGTGKTTLSRWLAQAANGAAISSDRVRKHLAGLAPQQRAGAGLYTPAERVRVYAALLERAAPVLASGRTAVLDATWARREARAAAAELARKHGASFRVVQATCPPEEAHERLKRRAARGDDASDAGPERLAESLAGFEAPEEDERGHWERIATDRADWRERAHRLLGTDSPQG